MTITIEESGMGLALSEERLFPIENSPLAQNLGGLVIKVTEFVLLRDIEGEAREAWFIEGKIERSPADRELRRRNQTKIHQLTSI